MLVPLPEEWLLWSGRSVLPSKRRTRYYLTDLRLASAASGQDDEVLVEDIVDVSCAESRMDRLLGTSTLRVERRDSRQPPLVLHHIRRGPQLAALLELLAGANGAVVDVDAARAALRWQPRNPATPYRGALVGVATALFAIAGAAIGLHGTSRLPAPAFAPDDPILPGGHHRPQAEIVRFMEEEVLPWAREALGPIKGGASHVTCATCHGQQAEARGWTMPAVAALPQSDVRRKGWELYGGAMDAQMRNAIYGYNAESEKQTKAAYMREIVMPGMARLLHRPAYDFTRPYEFNRAQGSFGCYHCHRVK